MKSNICKKIKVFFLFLTGCIFLIITAGEEIRAEGIHARYLENSGMRTVLELTVEDPPPSSVIVQQRIPQGTEIQSTIPPYIKFVASKGVVKWLFKQPQPGVVTIVLNYSKPLAARGATAVIRCKNPRDGKLMTVHVN